MRITNTMMANKFLTESNAALNRLAKYQSQVDSTKRISNISDDPEATLLALRARNKLSNLELYNSNIKTAKSYLTEAESAVSALNDVLKSAYDGIVSAGSGAKTQAEMRIIAEDLKNLQDEILSIANTSIGTSYIFGGFNFTGKIDGTEKIPPFSLKNGNLVYNGIDLSKISWKSEFDASVARMYQAVTSPDGSDLRSVAEAFVNDSNDYGDTYAKGQVEQMLGSIKTLLSAAEEVMTAAEAYGIDTNADEYRNFKANFYDKMVDIKRNLETEFDKDVLMYIPETAVPEEHKLSDGTIDYEYYKQQGIHVLTAAEIADIETYKETNNYFSKQNIFDILDGSLMGLISGSPGTMTTEINSLSGVVTMPLNATDYATSVKYVNDMLLQQKDGSDIRSLMASYQTNHAAPAFTAAQARDQARAILDDLKAMIANGNMALQYVDHYDVANAVTGTAEYTAVNDLFNTTLTGLMNSLELAVEADPTDKGAINNILNVGAGSLSAILSDVDAIKNTINALTTRMQEEDIIPLNPIDIPTEASKITKLQIGTSQTADITITGLELLGTGDKNIYHAIGKAIKILESGTADTEALGRIITTIQDAQSSVLTVQTRIGATQNRMDMISDRYFSSELNYTAMRSEAEDVDMAEAIMNLTTAKTVYNAALAGGAELLRTSLIDFLR